MRGPYMDGAEGHGGQGDEDEKVKPATVVVIVLTLVVPPFALLDHAGAQRTALAPPRAEHGLVSPLLSLKLRRLHAVSRHRGEGVAPAMIPVEITATRDVSAEVRQLGGRLEANVRGRVLAARVPATRIAALARIRGVAEVYASQGLREQLDVSVPEIGATRAWTMADRTGLPLRGRHVLVGIVDSGIDYHNADFKNPDGSSRIKYIWDQTQNGHAPAGLTFGYECDSASIDAGTCPERDTDGHGTHIAGIAAGNGRSSDPAKEIGVAPEADLIVVKSDLHTDKIMAAWTYLVDRAKQLGEPIVINNSFGDQLAPHDGSEPDALAADALSGPGRIFVAAAGNQGNKGLHTGGTVTQGKSASLTVQSRGDGAELTFGLFYGRTDTLSFTLTDTQTGESFGPVNTGDKLDGRVNKAGTMSVSMDAGAPDSAHHGLLVDLDGSAAHHAVKGEWRLDIQGTSVTGGGRYDAWLDDGNGGGQSFLNPDESDTISSPADGRSIISVANYVTRLQWRGSDGQDHTVCTYYFCANAGLATGDIKASSSRGPTADGRQKPDISAPGTMIISSLSRDVPICSIAIHESCADPALVTPDRKNLVESGTSMSAPHIAGVLALMLQANPSLDPAHATAMLRSTARHDGFTGAAAWTPTFGAGKVDAYGAALAALHGDARPLIATSTPTASASHDRPAFRILALRVERGPGSPAPVSSSGPGARFSPGTHLTLSVYTTYDGPLHGVSVSIHWAVTRNGTLVLRRRSTRRGPLRGLVWDHMQFAPRLTGAYVFTASIRVGGVLQQQSRRFRIVSAG